jgi:hypothetical protein
MKVALALWLGCMCFVTAFSQKKNITVSGYIKEKSTHETLIGVNIYIKENPSLGTVSNPYGFYSLSFPPGSYTLVYSYIGYESFELKQDFLEDQELPVTLSPGILMEEIVISDEEKKKDIESTQMGTIELKMDKVKKLPTLMGEVDMLKILQLLPGVSSATEGSSALYVRGGGPDQNLVLLDEAVVYNTGHLLGFFSVFNSDAIKNTTLIKGNMPAEYGSRISSVIDVQMKDGNMNHWTVEGGIGLIASRLTVQGPILKNKCSVIFSGRRTYALDLAQPFINKTKFKGTNYFFHDFNAKANYILGKKDRIFFSGYFGRDVFSFADNDRDFDIRLPYGNTTLTLRWNHIVSDKLFFNTSLISNNYSFKIAGGQDDFKFAVNSGVIDYVAKAQAEYYPNSKHTVRSGFRYTWHKLSPNVVTGTNGETDFNSGFDPKYGHENEIFLSDDWHVSSWWRVNLGMRLSNFIQVGPYTSQESGEVFGRNEIAKMYFEPEPRLIVNRKINSNSALKAGVSRAAQYVHLVSSSNSTLPNDVWVPSSAVVKPQIAWQYTLGYYTRFNAWDLDFSVETYFKDLANQLDYRDSYVDNFSDELENEFVAGKGKAYGIEFLLQKNVGNISGWIGYTLSRSERKFDEIENGRIFRTSYDRPHDLVVVGQYQLNKKWQLSANFVYATGRAYTPIRSVFIIQNEPQIEYGLRNSERLKSYHRLDFSAVYSNESKNSEKYYSTWAFSVYNVYNRKNPFFSYTDFESDYLKGRIVAKSVNVSIFTIIPAVTWNFYWRIK